MNKTLSFILFAFLVLSFQSSFAKSELSEAAMPAITEKTVSNEEANQTENTKTVEEVKKSEDIQTSDVAQKPEEQKQQEAAPAVSKQTASTPQQNDLNLNDNSFEITDEQFEEAKKIAEPTAEKQGLGDRIINSSYFYSSTPSKTYMPLNKAK